MISILERLGKEAAVIKAAPLSFAVAVGLASLLIFSALFFAFKQRMENQAALVEYYREKAGLSTQAGIGPSLTVSENTITPSHSIHHVGAGVIKNITVPPGFNSGVIYLIPDGIFTADTTGNIRNSFAASVDQVVLASYDGKKWSLLTSPFSDTGTTLSTNRDLKVSSFETTEAGDGKLELYETRTKRWLSWSVGHDAPKGQCVTGSVYTRSGEGAGATLFVCESSAWVAK